MKVQEEVEYLKQIKDRNINKLIQTTLAMMKKMLKLEKKLEKKNLSLLGHEQT